MDGLWFVRRLAELGLIEIGDCSPKDWYWNTFQEFTQTTIRCNLDGSKAEVKRQVETSLKLNLTFWAKRDFAKIVIDT